MKRLTILAGLIAVLALAGGAQGSVAFYEPFNYTVDSSLLDNGYSNGYWYGNAHAAMIQANSVAYNGLVKSGNKMYVAPGSTKVDAFGRLPAAVTNLFQSAGTFYVTFLLYGGGTGVNFGILDSYETPTQQADVLNLLHAYVDIWGWRLIAGGQDSGWLYHYTPGPNLFAFKIVNDGGTGADSVSLVINPALSAGEPVWATQRVLHNTGDITKAVDGFTLSGNFIAQSYDSNVDEIRVATTWAEAAPYQPPITPPTAPTGLGAIATTGGIPAINLTWTDNADNEDGYSVERGPTATGPWALITATPLPVNAKTYHDPDLLGETTYYYRVQAYNGAGGSNYSNVANAKTSVSSVPDLLTYQGKLTNAAGEPVADNTYALVFKLYDAETGGELQWTSADTPAATSSGLFTAKIRNVPPGVFVGNTHIWMEIAVNGETLLPRLEVGSDPYSMRAGYVQP